MYALLRLVCAATLAAGLCPGAQAARPSAVRFVVVDQAGEPVPTAGVRFDLEGERHRVSAAGRFAISSLYPADGSPILLIPGTSVSVEILAPGYAPRKVAVTAVRRGPEQKITLEPITLALPRWDGADREWIQLGRAAIDAAKRWRSAELDQLADPTEDGAQRRYEARVEAAMAAAEWGDHARFLGAPVPLAGELCRAAASDAADCPE